jgi:FkbM family methyltransferase
MTLVVLANESVGWRLIAAKEYEDWEMDSLAQLIRRDDTCIDVGANVGLYTVFMAQHATSGSVIAFEPVPLNRDLLSLNVRLNQLSNVAIHGSVVSDTSDPVRFSITVDGAYSSIRNTGRRTIQQEIIAEATTLDREFLGSRRRIDVVKIDVEGAELLVIQGAKQLLSDPDMRPRVLLVELDAVNQHAYNTSPSDVIGYMASFGYRAHSVTPRGIEPGYPRPGCVDDVLFFHEQVRTS